MVILPTEIGIEQIYIEAINDLIIQSACTYQLIGQIIRKYWPKFIKID